ncbi:MAG: hypothetical protein ACHQHN_08630 [Sphingobacteriales bacterium]
MKKIYLILIVPVISCLFFTTAKAQVKTGAWSIDVGPNVALPIRNLSYFTSLGIGADIAATTPISGGFAVGARANYSYFIGKTPLLGTSANGASVFNITADGSYTLPQNVFIGVDLGLGHATTNGQNDTEFARIFNLGYKWEQSKQHTYIFTVYFDQTTYEKCLGVRAAIRL